MRKFTFKKIMSLVILIASLSLTSCGSDDDGSDSGSGIETIVDSDGLKIELVWAVDGSSEPESDVDLDFNILNSDNNFVLEADNGGNFESENFLDSMPDGTYRIVVEYYEGSKVANYSLIITGLNGTEARTVTGDIGSSDTNDNTEISVLTFVKSGNTYTFM